MGKENQLSFSDLDEEIETVAKQTIADIFEKKGEDYFRKVEKNVLTKFKDKNDFLLACGGGTPCFLDNLAWMNQQGTIIYLRANAQTILLNIMNETQERPLLNKLNPSELLFFIEQKLKEREPFYMQAKHIVGVDALTAFSLPEILNNKY
jgi:shikimate kinase